MIGNQKFIRITYSAVQLSFTSRRLHKNTVTIPIKHNIKSIKSVWHKSKVFAFCQESIRIKALPHLKAMLWTQNILYGNSVRLSSGCNCTVVSISQFSAVISTTATSAISTLFMVPVLMMSELLLLALSHCSSFLPFHCTFAFSSFYMPIPSLGCTFCVNLGINFELCHIIKKQP